MISRLTRAVRMLSADEITELKDACARFGQAWRTGYRDLLTVKGHVVEVHVPEFAEWYGPCGIQGEEELKACIHKTPWFVELFDACAILRPATRRTHDISGQWSCALA